MLRSKILFILLASTVLLKSCSSLKQNDPNEKVVDMSAPEAYGIIAWLSWTINLFAVEIYLRLKSSLMP